MSTIFRTIGLSFLLFSFFTTNAKEPSKTGAIPNGVQSDEIARQKAQNNNTVRSNRTDGKASIDQSNSGSTLNNTNNAANTKRGYDYYKAQTDMNSAKSATSTTSTTKAQDYNSSRSNKTASQIDKGNNSGVEEKRVNKVESISIK